MRTSPASGTSSPFVVLRRTLLPVPEGPTMESVSPVSTVRLTPLRTGRSKALWTSMYSITSVQEEGRERRVQDEDGDDHEDDGGGGGAADPFRPAPGAEAHVHRDERDDEAEDEPLVDRVEQVPAVPEEPGAEQEGLRAEPDREAGGHEPGEDPDEVREAHEEGHGDRARDDAGGGEHGDRVPA